MTTEELDYLAAAIARHLTASSQQTIDIDREVRLPLDQIVEMSKARVRVLRQRRK